MRTVKFNFCLLAAAACIFVGLLQPGLARRIVSQRLRPTTPPPKKAPTPQPNLMASLKGTNLGRAYEYQYHLNQFDEMVPPLNQANSLPTDKFAVRMWPKGIVPYVFGEEFTELEKFILSHAIWQFNTQTCIRFVERTNQPYYVTLMRARSGCWSYTGRYTKNQFNRINLEPHCFSQGPGMIVHEMMHCIGFHHEFIRPDRDNYIWVNKTATFSWPAVEKNFAVKATSESETYGTEFDYGSVMMYSRYAASAGYFPTMVNTNPWEGEFGNLTGFSVKDLIRVNMMYCNGTKWDVSVRQPFSLPIPVDDGAEAAPERPTPPAVIPVEEATMGELVY